MHKQERNLRIHELHKSGQTFEVLGRQFGISKSRAQRIVSDIDHRRIWDARKAEDLANQRSLDEAIGSTALRDIKPDGLPQFSLKWLTNNKVLTVSDLLAYPTDDLNRRFPHSGCLADLHEVIAILRERLSKSPDS